MNTEKVGKLISRLRKEKNLTQQELGDILGVSPKTISKWECGNGFPDISIIKKISDEFNITLEELLDGNKKVKPTKKYSLIFLIISILILVLILLLFSKNNDEKIYDCTVIKTYYIENISNSNDENYKYITVSEFQTEGTFTIKLSKIDSEKLEKDKSYEFTFNINKENINSTTDILFDNSEIINIKESDKVGLDRVNTYYCN